MMKVDNSQITPLYANTSPGLTADAGVVDPAIAALVTAVNTNDDNFINFIGALFPTPGELSIPDQSIVTRHLRNLAVTNPKLAPLAVTADKIADGTITTAKLADLVVTAAKIADYTITENKYVDKSVSTRALADYSVTYNKIDPAIFNPISDAGINARFLKVEDKISDIATINLEDYSAYATNIGNSNENWTPAVDKAIDDLVTAGGGVLLVPRLFKINTTIRLGGYIPPLSTYPDYQKVVIWGNYIGGFVFTGAGGSGTDFIKLSRPTVALRFSVVFKELIVDCNYKEVIAINGFSDVSNTNNIVEFHKCRIIKFNGPTSKGIEGGSMTDCRIHDTTIQGGDNQGVGVEIRRSNVKLFDCTINYCNKGVVLPNFAEGNIQMFGGGIHVCNYCVYIRAGMTGSNTSYFFGTFMGENYLGSEIFKSETPDASDIGSLTMVGVAFGSANVTEPLLNFDFGGRVTMIGCDSWFATAINKVRKGQYCELIMLGNSSHLVYDTAGSSVNSKFNALFRENGGDVNATGGFKQVLPFYYTGILNHSATRLLRNPTAVKSYTMPFSGSIMAISAQLSATVSSSVSFQVGKNSSGISGCDLAFSNTETKKTRTFTKDQYSFSAGDTIEIQMYATNVTAGIDAGLEITIES